MTPLDKVVHVAPPSVERSIDPAAPSRQRADRSGAMISVEAAADFASAADLAQAYPQYAPQIISAARSSFVDGQDWAYLAGAIAVVLGAALVFFLFPKRDQERAMLQGFHEQDLAEAAAEGTPAPA